MRSKGDLGSTLGSGRSLRFQQLLSCIPPSLEAFPDSSGDSSAYCLPLHPPTPRTGPALGSCFHILWLKPWADSACADCFIYSCFQGLASPTRTQGKVRAADCILLQEIWVAKFQHVPWGIQRQVHTGEPRLGNLLSRH